MPALLSLIPLKDYIYGGVIIALLIAFGWYTHHERTIGAQRVAAADAKVVAIQLKHDEDIQNASKAAADKALADYKAAVLQPVVLPVTRIVCNAAGRGAVPGSGGAPAGTDAGPAHAGPDTAGFDPSVPALEAGRDADSQIAALQALIRSYQAAGIVAK